MSIFNFIDLPPRVIVDGVTPRFIWVQHNYSTTYMEPYQYVQANGNQDQGYTPNQSVRPYRIMTLSFPIMHLKDSETAGKDWLNTVPELDFGALVDFYKQVGMHTRFIYNHPIYGDMYVRFSKPLQMPKKNVDGTGTVQAFEMEITEVVTSDFMFFQGEDWSGDLDFLFNNMDIEIQYPQDASGVTLGSNYQVVFADPQQKIRRFTVTLEGMQYYTNNGIATLNCKPDNNMALLEVFYLKNRLTKVFNINYLDEVIPVQFVAPLKIPSITGSNGVTEAVQLSLIEVLNTVPSSL